ncbi:MAG: ATPase, partial [Clostridia bacterium]|nr:ATPase [Clostridia bacterium]
LEAPVSVMETAGEGGPWGMALLAAYRVQRSRGETLEEFLNERVFKHAETIVCTPDEEDMRGFDVYCSRFEQALDMERAAVQTMPE